ncbi:MAG: glycosyltransferase [Planctomycetota bacterium]
MFLPSIIHYRSTLDPAQGGVVAHVSDLALLCRDAGARVTIVAPSETPRPKNLDPGGGLAIETIGKPALGGVLLSGAQRRRFAELAADHDVVHLHGAWTLPNFQLASDAMERGQPYLATPHGMLDDWCLKHKGWKKMPFLAVVPRDAGGHGSRGGPCCFTEHALSDLVRTRPQPGEITVSEPNPSHDAVFRAGRLQNAPAEHDLAYLEARKIDADALDVACARRPAKRKVWDVAVRGVAAG